MRRSTSQFSVFSVFALGALFLFNQWQKSQQPTRHSTSSRSASRSRSKAHARLVQDTIPPAGTTGATQGGDSNEGNLLLGNATNAATDPDNFLVVKPQYTLSYNHSRGSANWVAWHVDYADLGAMSRGKFHPDPALPADWQITPRDYTGSGFDRGHMCPSGDRTATREDNDATFCMSNMVPQTAALNQHVWADLEDYVRSQVRAGNEIYQITGPAGNAGTVAGGKVTVPASCWKVIVVIPESTGDLGRVSANTRVIAVSMPNEQSDTVQNADWHTYITTAKKIEDSTGLTLFTALPSKIKTALENKTDAGA